MHILFSSCSFLGLNNAICTHTARRRSKNPIVIVSIFFPYFRLTTEKIKANNNSTNFTFYDQKIYILLYSNVYYVVVGKCLFYFYESSMFFHLNFNVAAMHTIQFHSCPICVQGVHFVVTKHSIFNIFLLVGHVITLVLNGRIHMR